MSNRRRGGAGGRSRHDESSIIYGAREMLGGGWTRWTQKYCERWWKAWLAGIFGLLMIGSIPGFWVNSRTYEFAVKYHEQQRPLIAESRQQFVIHKYFELPDPTANGSRPVNWIEMISLRIKKWADEQRAGNSMHEVEKDKCVCQKFMNDIGVRAVPILGEWRDTNWNRTEFGNTLATADYPIIIKLGHIQQSKALRIFRDRAKAISQTPNIAGWVESWFPQRFDDATRSWANDVNVLYNALKPCVLVHPVLTGDWIAVTGAPFELKVEVVWGRAYLAFLETRLCARKFLGLWLEPQSSLILTRDRRIMRFVEWPKRFEWEWTFPWDQVGQYFANVPHENPADSLLREYSWLLSGKILDRVFATAEAVADRIGAEQVRVDIFVSKNPDEMPIVNEISLSSGHYYRYHTKFLSEEWAEGHRARDSKRYEGPLPVPDSMLGTIYHDVAQQVISKK